MASHLTNLRESPSTTSQTTSAAYDGHFAAAIPECGLGDGGDEFLIIEAGRDVELQSGGGHVDQPSSRIVIEGAHAAPGPRRLQRALVILSPRTIDLDHYRALV